MYLWSMEESNPIVIWHLIYFLHRIYIGYSKHRSGGVQTIKPGRTHKGYVYMHLISTMCSKKISTRVWYSYRNRSVYISSL